MSRLSRIVAIAIATASLGLVVTAVPGGAAPSPASVTVGVGGAAPATAAVSGGPITGTADGAGSTPVVACVQPACEMIGITLKAPTGFTATNALALSATFTFDSGPGGLLGMDVYLLDATGAVVASNVNGASPALVSASKLTPGQYSVQITGDAAGVNTTYTAAITASSVPLQAPTSQAGVPQQIDFGPATIVSPTILGAEPQISMERPTAAAIAGALDPRRGYVDWPVSSRTQIGTLWRTLNSGDSYRILVDQNCAPRQVPTCFVGGGGDTVNRVNQYDGTLLFGSQESLAQEAFASSIDHGDSFPAARQFAATSSATGVDRQWISAVDGPAIAGAGKAGINLAAIYSYHIPLAGELVAGVDTNGIVYPAIIPSINPVTGTTVSQSGPSRIDSNPASPGYGYFYQPYRDGSSFKVGVAPVVKYDDPTAYTVQTATMDLPVVFPWINLDRSGNVYAVWVPADGQAYMAYSLINDPKNNPKATPAGVPGTKWSPRIRLNPAGVTSTQFPEVIAGDAGNIAVSYYGTSDYAGGSDNAPLTTRWNTYVTVVQNALTSSPTLLTGAASHHPVHTGSICSRGTTCITPPQGDRSLLDMIDVTMDADGRPMVVYQDNNNQFGRDESSLGSSGSPFVKVARLAHGPSLLNGHPAFSTQYPVASRPSGAGDATWPNITGAKNLPALDILGSGVYQDGTDVVGRIDLADATAAGMARDLTAYNAVRGTDVPASRLQYVVRWETPNDVFYAAAESDAAGGLTAYGGKVDATDAVNNVNSAVGVTYTGQSGYPVTVTRKGNSLFLRAPLAKFGLKPQQVMFSLAGYSFAGPADVVVGGTPLTQLAASVRNIDSSPPFDAVLADAAFQPTLPGGGTVPVVPQQPTTSTTPSGLVNTASGAGAAGAGVAGLLVAAVIPALSRRRRRLGRAAG